MTITLGKNNIGDAKSILKKDKRYIDVNGELWTYDEMIEGIYDFSDEAEDFYGDWVEVEERDFFWAEEETISIDWRGVNFYGNSHVEQAESQEDAEGTANGMWNSLCARDKACRMVTAYKGRGFTLEETMERGEYESTCHYLKYNNNEYCLYGRISYDDISRIAMKVEEFAENYDGDWDSDPNAIDCNTYRLAISNPECSAVVGINRMSLDEEDGYIDINSIIEVREII